MTEKLRASLRWVILTRDNFRCVFCGLSSLDDDTELQVDHLYPASKGGESDPFNLVTTCQKCNAGKTDKLLDNNTLTKMLAVVAERNKKLKLTHPLFAPSLIPAHVFRQHRLDIGLSRKDFGELLGGYSYNAIANIENGYYPISRIMADKFWQTFPETAPSHWAKIKWSLEKATETIASFLRSRIHIN